MKTETNITMEDIGNSEIPENFRCPGGLLEVGLKFLKHQPNESKWRSQHRVARSSFARLCSTAKRNILVTNFDHHSAWVATPFGDSHLGALSGVWSHVRSLLLGSSLLEAFNPIDGPEVLGHQAINWIEGFKEAAPKKK